MAPPVTRIHAVIFVSGLMAGGAERTAIRLSGWLRDSGYEVCLLTLTNPDTDFYSYPEGIERVGLGMQANSSGPLNAIWNNIRRLYSIRVAVQARRADVVVTLGHMSNVLMLLALIGVKCRKIISERNDPALEPLSLAWNLLRRLTYPTASLHVSQSEYASKWIQSRFPKLPCTVIGNTAGTPEVEPFVQSTSKRETNVPIRIISIGSLNRRKGMDLLLSAFGAAIKQSPIPIELIIAGEGIERGRLEAQLEAQGLKGEVTLLGAVTDVWALLRNSDIYILASRFEGFPNVLVEAMAAGLPIIAARCQGSVDEILGSVPNRYALEFPPENSAKLGDAIVKLAASPELRQNLGLAALNRAKDFSPDKISAAWIGAVRKT